jgi:predicted O-methyltransferase YrrM
MISKPIEEYIIDHTSPEPPLLAELNRFTHLHTPYPRMISGHVQGRFLALISKLIRPVRILEIGTFTGYSTICLSEGLITGGKIDTIEAEAVFAGIAGRFFKKAGIENQVELHLGDALEILPSFRETFDLVFIDAAKEQYESYYNLVVDQVRSGGLILADNVLWDGKVAENPGPGDPETRGIIEFNKLVQEDSRVENVILSVRDGISVIRKL